jgi:hypothetical protein
MGSTVSTEAAIGTGIGCIAAIILLAAALRSFMRVRTEVAMVKARLQDVWSVQPGEIKVDPEQCEACGQSSSGELLYRAEYRGMVRCAAARAARRSPRPPAPPRTPPTDAPEGAAPPALPAPPAGAGRISSEPGRPGSPSARAARAFPSRRAARPSPRCARA